MAKLYFRYGAMNSGKSTALMQVAHNYEEQGMRVLILKPQVDTKGGDELVSRLGVRRKADLLVVIFTLFGIALFFFDQLQPGYILGNFVAIAAGMFMAGMFMAVGDLEGEMRFSAIMIGQFLTFLIGLPSIIITKPEFTLTATAGIIILGVFQLGIAYILYVKSTKYCPPLACSLLGAVEPLLNPVWVLIFYGEKPGVFALIGGVVVIVTITVWCIKGQEKAPEEAKA